ncbi:MAG: hypothetical protein ABW051_00965 [Burkholderiaceae bacterium]
MTAQAAGIRERGFADFSRTPPETLGGNRHWLARGQNFWLEWIEFAAGGSAASLESRHETMVIASAGTVTITAAGAAPVAVAAHSVAIVAPGRYEISGEASAVCNVFTSHRGDLANRRVIGEAAYAAPDARIVPTGHPYRRKQRDAAIQVLDIGAVMASKDKPRLKMLQTETLSINIVEYAGPRNRAELSPHSHPDFEQGSLAISGDFVHHLRAPWGSDADQWKDDEHLCAPSPSLLVVPVELIHTTEGVGDGHHFLVDLFSPPRADFIGKGWVANAADYEPAEAKQA